MNVKDRIKSFIRSGGMSVSEFEKSISVANGYVNSISRSIGVDKLESMLEKYPALNIEWLITGRGEMLHKDVEVKQKVSGDGNFTLGRAENFSGGITCNDKGVRRGDSPEVLQAKIEERDRLLLEKEERIREKDAQLKEKDAQLREKDMQIDKLLDIIKSD